MRSLLSDFLALFFPASAIAVCVAVVMEVL